VSTTRNGWSFRPTWAQQRCKTVHKLGTVVVQTGGRGGGSSGSDQGVICAGVCGCGQQAGQHGTAWSCF
jgi:hypothetical protein